ncbi:MAG: hypothetical protein LBG27_12910 [Spirochaetaceae bacterium]|jgi:predicted transposase YdaD|nr:hypothetical protein [Spirochaetaceae bacterium]
MFDRTHIGYGMRMRQEGEQKGWLAGKLEGEQKGLEERRRLEQENKRLRREIEDLKAGNPNRNQQTVRERETD